LRSDSAIFEISGGRRSRTLHLTLKNGADPRNDEAYCERYWKDYGNAVRAVNGRMVPRMFDDLPVCVAAFKARKALANDAR
jgi:hypothetical protein